MMRSMWFHIIGIGAFLTGFYVADNVDRDEPLAMFVAVVLGFLAMCAVYLFKDQLDRAESDQALAEEARTRQHGEATPAENIRKTLNRK